MMLHMPPSQWRSSHIIGNKLLQGGSAFWVYYNHDGIKVWDDKFMLYVARVPVYNDIYDGAVVPVGRDSVK